MTPSMRINEIFYSLQGEGYHTGRPAVFIRFSGCNLDCTFCDTDHSKYVEMTEEEIVMAATAVYGKTDRVESCKAANAPMLEKGYVVLTGGEPAMQVTDTFVDKLHQAGFEVAIETNGTFRLPPTIDWVTLSPKQGTDHLAVTRCDELKVVFKESADDYESIKMVKADHYYLQPCDMGDEVRNRQILKECIEYILAHPTWRLSLQTHKLIGIR